MTTNDIEWQSLPMVAEWQADKFLFNAIQHSVKECACH